MNIKTIKLKYEKNLLSILGVTGVGLDRINQKIIVYIDNPKTFNFGRTPSSLKGFDIEFRIAPQPSFLQSSCYSRDRPLIGGNCFGVEWYSPPFNYLSCGTLGAVVRNADTHEEFLLTNRHVIEDNDFLPVIDVINPCNY